MHLRLMKVAPDWFRVLNVSQVYSEDRLKLDENIIEINGVSFLTSDALANMGRTGYRSNGNDTYVVAKETAYDHFVFLTSSEIRNAILHYLEDYINNNTDYGMYIKHDYSKSYAVIYKKSKITTTGNLYTDSTPYEKIIAKFMLNNYEYTSTFDNQEAKDVELNKFVQSVANKLNPTHNKDDK